MASKERVLGLDPGYALCGFGVIDQLGSTMRMVNYGVIRTTPEDSHPRRLLKIGEEIGTLLDYYRPDRVAIEELFFSRNVTTALQTSEARGVMVYACASRGLPIYEYKPAEAKMAVTGNGNAEKRQVQQMVKMLLGLEHMPKIDDAADALAIAICQIHHGAFGKRLKGGYQ